MTEPNYPSARLELWPTIEFFYLDEKHPETPSHVWWGGRAYGVDPEVFHRVPTMHLSQDDYVRFEMGPIELVDNLPAELATRLDLLRLRSAKTRVGKAFADVRRTFEEGPK